jgi:hypothetical protein
MWRSQGEDPDGAGVVDERPNGRAVAVDDDSDEAVVVVVDGATNAGNDLVAGEEEEEAMGADGTVGAADEALTDRPEGLVGAEEEAPEGGTRTTDDGVVFRPIVADDDGSKKGDGANGGKKRTGTKDGADVGLRPPVVVGAAPGLLSFVAEDGTEVDAFAGDDGLSVLVVRTPGEYGAGDDGSGEGWPAGADDEEALVVALLGNVAAPRTDASVSSNGSPPPDEAFDTDGRTVVARHDAPLKTLRVWTGSWCTVSLARTILPPMSGRSPHKALQFCLEGVLGDGPVLLL